MHLELPSGDREAQGLEQPAPRRQGLSKGWMGSGCRGARRGREWGGTWWSGQASPPIFPQVETGTWQLDDSSASSLPTSNVSPDVNPIS